MSRYPMKPERSRNVPPVIIREYYCARLRIIINETQKRLFVEHGLIKETELEIREHTLEL